jgi:transcriptional regulator with XRE-family HTH domain
MNAIELKEKRKAKGITQKKLAELIGVSTQTVNGYENGKEIPSTKYQILDTVLSGPDIVSEPATIYPYFKKTIYDEEIERNKEKIKEHQKIIDISIKPSANKEHHIEIVRLLNTQITILLEAKEDFINNHD